MLIKLIPETEVEKKRFKGLEEVEHLNVKEYFFVGNKIDGDGAVVEFHEWTGPYRFLLGTLSYFYEIINDERRRSAKQDAVELPPPPNISQGRKNVPPMIKRAEGGKIQKVDFGNLKGESMGEGLVEGPKLEFKPKDAPIEDDFIDGPPDKNAFTVMPAEEMQAEDDETKQPDNTAVFTVEDIDNAAKAKKGPDKKS